MNFIVHNPTHLSANHTHGAASAAAAAEAAEAGEVVFGVVVVVE